jgi:hypothetical protein
MGRDNWGESGAAAARCNTADNKRTSDGGLQAAKASILDAPRGVGVENLICSLPNYRAGLPIQTHLYWMHLRGKPGRLSIKQLRRD